MLKMEASENTLQTDKHIGGQKIQTWIWEVHETAWISMLSKTIFLKSKTWHNIFPFSDESWTWTSLYLTQHSL